jgi:NADPH2:quinone reductase
VDFRRILLKRLHHTGSTLRSRSVADKAAIARRRAECLAADRRRPHRTDQAFPLAEAARAHARMESSAHIGKIVLTV